MLISAEQKKIEEVKKIEDQFYKMLDARKDALKNIIPDIDVNKSRQDDDREQKDGSEDAGNEAAIRALNVNSSNTRVGFADSQANMEKNKLMSNEAIEKHDEQEIDQKEISPSPTVQDIVPTENSQKESHQSLNKKHESKEKAKIEVKDKKKSKGKKQSKDSKKDSDESDSSNSNHKKSDISDSDDGKKDDSGFDYNKKDSSDKNEKKDLSNAQLSSKQDFFGDDKESQKGENPIDGNE